MLDRGGAPFRVFAAGAQRYQLQSGGNDAAERVTPVGIVKRMRVGGLRETEFGPHLQTVKRNRNCRLNRTVVGRRAMLCNRVPVRVELGTDHTCGTDKLTHALGSNT